MKFNATLSHMELSGNPLGQEGMNGLAGAKESAAIEYLGLRNIEAAPRLTSDDDSYVAFDPKEPDGHYLLNLDAPWDHAVAELLFARVRHEGGKWLFARLDGVECATDASGSNGLPLLL